MSELIKNLLAAQACMNHAAATAKNPHFKSKYVPFEELMDYVKPILNDHGIYIQQVSHETEIGACVETVFHGHGERISTGPVTIRADKSTAQGYGSALTYARRYSLSMATGVGADKDDDANAATSQSQKRTAKPATVPANAEGQFCLRKGDAVIVRHEHPDEFLSACREHLREPSDEGCLSIYQSSKSDIQKAASEACPETKGSLEKLISIYEGSS